MVLYKEVIDLDFFDQDKQKYIEQINTKKEAYTKGVKLLNGINVEKDVKKGLDLLYESGKLGYSYALNAIGLAYTLELVEDMGTKEGIALIETAYSMGNPKAAHNLVHFYSKGIGVDIDTVKAEYFRDKFWELSKRAAYKNDEEIINFLKKDLKLDSFQIDEIISEYEKNLNCDVCEKKILEQNNKIDRKKISDILTDDLAEIHNTIPEEKGFKVDFVFKTDPIVPNGVCCYKCFLKFIRPLNELYRNQKINLRNMDILFYGNPVETRLLKIRSMLNDLVNTEIELDQDDIFPFEMYQEERNLLPMFLKFTKAQGFANALLNIGVIYENGDSELGIKINIRRAIYFYTFSMEFKSILAPINLCNILFTDTIFGNKEEARKIVFHYLDAFEKNAHLSYGIIPYNVGLYYINGHLINQDKRKNVELGLPWIELAAYHGNENAINSLDMADKKVI